MKPIAKNLLCLLSIPLLTWSCKKDFQESITTPPPTQTKITSAFKDLRVNQDFNWKTQRQVTLMVTPLEIETTIINSLKIKLPGSNKPIFAAKTSMNQAFTAKFAVPSAVEEVIISYGSIIKTVAIQNNSIHFDFLSE